MGEITENEVLLMNRENYKEDTKDTWMLSLMPLLQTTYTRTMIKNPSHSHICKSMIKIARL